MNAKSKSAPASGTHPLRLTVNAILPDGKGWVTAGDPLPYASAKEVPSALRRYILDPAQEQDQNDYPQEISANFQLFTPYNLNDKGERIAHRQLERQVAEIVSIDQERQALQNVIEEVGDVTAQALQAAQEDHETHIAGQIAQAKADAHREDAAKESAQQAVMDEDGLAQPMEGSIPAVPIVESTPQPKRMRKRYVRRGACFRLAKDVRVKVGESVFFKDQGAFIEFGKINRKGGIPAKYMEA